MIWSRSTDDVCLFSLSSYGIQILYIVFHSNLCLDLEGESLGICTTALVLLCANFLAARYQINNQLQLIRTLTRMVYAAASALYYIISYFNLILPNNNSAITTQAIGNSSITTHFHYDYCLSCYCLVVINVSCYCWVVIDVSCYWWLIIAWVVIAESLFGDTF
jgi:hypothetical protein